jgi:maltooligosyltrehalose trehalohydrolase
VDTYRRSVLDWAEPGRGVHRELLEWHRALIALRRSRPELNDPRLTEVAVDTGDGDGHGEDGAARWLVLRRGGVRVFARFDGDPGARPVRLPVPDAGASARLLLASEPGVRFDPPGEDGAPAAVVLPGAAVAVIA